MPPLALFKKLERRSMPQVRKAFGMFRGEGERVEIPFEAQEAHRAKRRPTSFCMSSLETLNRGHGIGCRAEANVPDDQFSSDVLSFQKASGEKRLLDVKFRRFLARSGH